MNDDGRLVSALVQRNVVILHHASVADVHRHDGTRLTSPPAPPAAMSASDKDSADDRIRYQPALARASPIAT